MKSTRIKVKFVRSFFGRNVSLKKSFRLCLTFTLLYNFCQKTSQFLGGKGGSIVSFASSLTQAFWLYDEHLSDCETPWLGHLFPWGRSYYIGLSRTSILSRVSPGDQNLIVLTESPSITTPIHNRRDYGSKRPLKGHKLQFVSFTTLHHASSNLFVTSKNETTNSRI